MRLVSRAAVLMTEVQAAERRLDSWSAPGQEGVVVVVAQAKKAPGSGQLAELPSFHMWRNIEHLVASGARSGKRADCQ